MTICFFIGVFASLLDTIPTGPINLAVKRTTVDHHARTGLESAPPAQRGGNLQCGWDRFAGRWQTSEDQSHLALIQGFFVLLCVSSLD
ncbi:MAG: hypothetical protein VXW46_02555 [Pseudomonadota bacterium]|nr:hypothetical protein [Pseudomonadota bacterium]